MRAVAVVPSYREAGTISHTVSSLLALEGIERVVVIDDASGDRTAGEASEAGATVVVNGRNLGKGGSVNRVTAELDFEALLLIDGDLGEHASEARSILEPVLGGNADLAIASFGPALRKGGFGLVKSLARSGIVLLSGRQMASPISGQRAMTRKAYLLVAPFANGFGMEVAMTIDALRAGLNVIEVPTTMSHGETGRDLTGFLHRGKQFRDIAVALLRRAIP
ncbi:MAG TPA: glycosyltransferase family 2 protein [Candidatus Anoxymicrobiaceae bacterium]